MSGSVSYHAGKVAEEIVARVYFNEGQEIVARRWRGRSGEIDVIVRGAGRVIFVEVKQSRSHAQAAEHLTQRQISRIWQTAAEFLAGEPHGQDTEVQFDVALVDGQGHVEIVRNAIAA